MAKYFLNDVQSYKFDTEEEVKAFIEETKEDALENNYVLTSYSSTKKEKKSKGEVVAEGYLVKINKTYTGFWDDLMEDF